MVNKKYTLRKFTEEDAKELYAALGDKRVVRHMASSGITLETCEKIISESIAHWQEHQIGSYAVLENENQSIIGWAGFKHWKNNEFEILIVLSPNHWGLGADILDELIEMAKNEFALNKAYILLPETRRSFRWVERKGFVFCENEIFHGESFKKFVKLF